MVGLFSSSPVKEGLPMGSRRPAPILGTHRRAPLVRSALPILWLAAGLLGALGVAGAAIAATPVGSEF
jgi:hypothetical protein